MELAVMFRVQASKELASKELGVLGYSDLLGMQWRSRLFRSIGIGRSR